MVQGAGLVNVIVKNTISFWNSAGVYTLGDGATAADVTPRTAAALALAGAILAASDVKILATDFKDFVLPLEAKNRS